MSEDERHMMITLEAWAESKFNPPPSLRTLRAWAKSGLIHPAAVKVGARYMVDENAEYRPLSIQADPSSMSELVKRIVYGSAA